MYYIWDLFDFNTRNRLLNYALLKKNVSYENQERHLLCLNL